MASIVVLKMNAVACSLSSTPHHMDLDISVEQPSPWIEIQTEVPARMYAQAKLVSRSLVAFLLTETH